MINKTNNIKNTPFTHIMSITKTNRIISVIITLLWVSVIFSFSLQPAETSSEISMGVGRWILEHLLPGMMQRFDSMPQTQLEFWHTLLRKAGHFSEFFVLGILSMFTARQMKFHRKKIVAFLFCVLVASMDETIQLFVSGRSGQVTDVILDSVGALFGIVGVLILKFLIGGATVSTKDKDNNITYINMPISSQEEDKIGIVQYANELRSVINKGAQSIAITSDFGGGKSSLVRYLESTYCRLFTKFCYVNLWSEFEKEKGTRDLHKSFIYQLANQISTRKGNYVSKRLSENYGIFTIAMPSFWTSLFSFIMLLFAILGFICTTLYEIVSDYITIGWYTEHHQEIGVVAFGIAVFLS